MGDPVALIIPALNEEEAISATLDGLPKNAFTQILVVDNGSTDRTAEFARARGAQVVREPRRGYGQACLAGIATLAPEVRIVVFMDGDGSDDPADVESLLAPIQQRQADLVIGSRLLGEREAGALTPQQQFGNRLATWLLRLLFGACFTDLGPFRAIRREALERLEMSDTNFGWTIEMQIKAMQRGLRLREVPVRYRRRRAGQSKVSGTLRGSLLAGCKIIWTILRYRFSS